VRKPFDIDDVLETVAAVAQRLAETSAERSGDKSAQQDGTPSHA
jgi:hypothetical protein